MKFEIRTTERVLTAFRRDRHWLRTITRPFFFLVLPWVAGIHATDAISQVKCLNKNGNKGLVNFLGEHYKDPQMVEHAVHEYRHLIRNIATQKKQDSNFNASVSIKPSQFGFDLQTQNPQESQAICFENMRSIVRLASQCGVGIEIDMEHSTYTAWTVLFYKKMLLEFENHLPHLRLCLQANLKRTEMDLELLLQRIPAGVKIGVRLVKGIYPEMQNNGAFHDEEEILSNFEELIKFVFENGSRFDIAIATHREDIILLAELLSAHSGSEYELEMLKGIGEPIKGEREQKHKPYTEYVPYGKDAFAYGWRRLKKTL